MSRHQQQGRHRVRRRRRANTAEAAVQLLLHLLDPFEIRALALVVGQIDCAEQVVLVAVKFDVQLPRPLAVAEHRLKLLPGDQLLAELVILARNEGGESSLEVVVLNARENLAGPQSNLQIRLQHRLPQRRLRRHSLRHQRACRFFADLVVGGPQVANQRRLIQIERRFRRKGGIRRHAANQSKNHQAKRTRKSG
jgi:hypothetical protein